MANLLLTTRKTAWLVATLWTAACATKETSPSTGDGDGDGAGGETSEIDDGTGGSADPKKRDDPMKSMGGEGGSGGAISSHDFVTIWEVTEDETSIELPLVKRGTYDFRVDWGDGTSDHIEEWDDDARGHEYDTPGQYTVVISGELDGWSFAREVDFDGHAGEGCEDSCYRERTNREALECSERSCDGGLLVRTGPIHQLLEVAQWGDVRLGSGEVAWFHFARCGDLTISAEDTPDVSGDLTGMFYACTPRFTGATLGEWDMSHVTGIGHMFQFSDLDPNLSPWDTSAMTDMQSTFSENHEFDGDISRWDVSNVETMENMFERSSFNGDISNWDVSNVRTMAHMFERSDFAGNLEKWDVSNLEDMAHMFESTSVQNGISSWDTSKVTNMSGLFRHARSVADVSAWDTSSVEDLSETFRGASVLSDISSWDVSSVRDMFATFHGATLTADLSDWDTSSVSDFTATFEECEVPFDVESWDTSSAESMAAMFAGATFSSDLSGWDTSLVEEASWMFFDTNFDGDLSPWNVSSIREADSMFTPGSLSRENYDKLLIGWAAQDVHSGVTLDVGDTEYSAGEASDARATLISKGWSLIDGGQAID